MTETAPKSVDLPTTEPEEPQLEPVLGSGPGPALWPLAQLGVRWHQMEKQLARHPLGRILGVGPRTAGYVSRTVWRRYGQDSIEGLPEVRLTPSHIGSVAMDEAILLIAKGPGKFPGRADYHRVGAEIADAQAMYRDRGWIDDPRPYHRTPPSLSSSEVRTSSGWAHGLSYERIYFPSEWEPYEDEPGRERWMGYHPNHIASAWVLRHHDDQPRPWLVCQHGFAMGFAFMEFPAFHAAHLHHDLGLNLIGPTLPVHGPRKVSALPGDEFLSFDLMNSVHGLAQSVWDVRRVLSWVRAQDPVSIGMYGFSLGGYVAALVASFEGALDPVIAGVPVTGFPALYSSQSPAIIRDRAAEHGILDGSAEEVHRVVSPLVLEPAIPLDARFIFAGQGDRMAHPRQAHDLWKHWDQPDILWYPGNHMGFMWSGSVKNFIDDTLRDRGLVGPT